MGIKFKLFIIIILSLVPFVFLYNYKKPPENIISSTPIKKKQLKILSFVMSFLIKIQN